MNAYPQSAMYPPTYGYSHTAIPQSHLYAQATTASAHNPYVQNYSQSILNQNQQYKITKS